MTRKHNDGVRKALQKAGKANPVAKSQKRENEVSGNTKPQKPSFQPTKLRKVLSLGAKILWAAAAVIGPVATLCSFFPHVAVSDPVQMDATDVFSYQFNVGNDGVLPIFGVTWALAPRNIKVSVGANEADNDSSQKHVQWTPPHRADWKVDSNLMRSVTKPDAERHAAIMIYPGSGLTVPGPADYEFRIRPEDSSIGTLSPGGQFTLTTEGLMSAPPGATFDTADFAIAIKYTPVFPPVPMQTCFHFHVYKDRQGKSHWFRAQNQCDRFAWMHHWSKNPDDDVVQQN